MKKLMVSQIAVEVLEVEVARIIGCVSTSKSGKMKELFHLGLDIKEIATIMAVRYNFVYNVISNLVIVDGVETDSTKKESKKDVVWALLDQGKTTKEIAVELKTNYNYIYKLKKEWDAEVIKEQAIVDAAEVKTQELVVVEKVEVPVVENKGGKKNKKIVEVAI